MATRGNARLSDPAVRDQVSALLAQLARLTDVTGITSPYGAGGAGQLSADGTVGFATVTYAVDADAITVGDGTALVTAARSFHNAGLDVAVEGQAATKAAEQHLGGVGLGIIAALIVLFLVFGSLLAASVAPRRHAGGSAGCHQRDRAPRARRGHPGVVGPGGDPHRARRRRGLCAVHRDPDAPRASGRQRRGVGGRERSGHLGSIGSACRSRRLRCHARPAVARGEPAQRPGDCCERRRAVHHGHVGDPAAGRCWASSEYGS